MNVKAAQNTLGSRVPKVRAPMLALEAVVVIGISMLLVGFFA